MTSSAWRVTVRNDGERAVATLIHGSRVMCVLNLSWSEYESLVKDLVTFVVDTATQILRTKLGQLLWKNASQDEAWRDITSPGVSADVAMAGLLQAGWTPERVAVVGGQLASFVADGLMRLLPKRW